MRHMPAWRVHEVAPCSSMLHDGTGSAASAVQRQAACKLKLSCTALPHTSRPCLALHGRHRVLESHGLHQFEIGTIANLLPESADEAMSLLPTLGVGGQAACARMRRLHCMLPAMQTACGSPPSFSYLQGQTQRAHRVHCCEWHARMHVWVRALHALCTCLRTVCIADVA